MFFVYLFGFVALGMYFIYKYAGEVLGQVVIKRLLSNEDLSDEDFTNLGRLLGYIIFCIFALTCGKDVGDYIIKYFL